MKISQLSFLLVVFVVVCALCWVALALFAPVALRERLRQFLGQRAAQGVGDVPRLRWIERIASVARPLTRLSIPEEGWEKSTLRTRFMNAGWRNTAAPTLYFAAKTVLVLLAPAVLTPVLLWRGGTSGRMMLMILLCGAALGYYLPNAVLARRVKRRRREIFETIPDALDLLTVCVEAGLSLERALVKVAAEIHIKSVVLAQEMQIVLMEMRAGFTKEKALRNFALRSGVDDVDTLVAMLIQSERFGTSVGDALRVYADNLRHKRRMIAEETAARIGLKLLFPLIFCIFPTLMMVLLGPAAIQISRAMSALASAR